jgi:hypothetical protein
VSAPRLSPTVVTDDTLLARAIDEVIQADDEDQRHCLGIQKVQTELRARVDDETWKVFLRLDAATNARLADLTVTITTWAFVQGQLDAGKGDVR